MEMDSKHAHGFVHGTIGGCPHGCVEEFITMHVIHFVLCVDGIHKLEQMTEVSFLPIMSISQFICRLVKRKFC